MENKPVKFLFTKSKWPLSGLIMWGLEEPCSHFVIGFDEKIVFHTNLLGVHLKWFRNFLKSNEVVFQLDLDADLAFQESLYQDMEESEGKFYDFGAFFYFVWRAFLKKFFGKPFPKTNAWASSDSFLCTGLARPLQKHGLIPADADLEMISPFQVYGHLKQALIELKKKEMGVSGG